MENDSALVYNRQEYPDYILRRSGELVLRSTGEEVELKHRKYCITLPSGGKKLISVRKALCCTYGHSFREPMRKPNLQIPIVELCQDGVEIARYESMKDVTGSMSQTQIGHAIKTGQAVKGRYFRVAPLESEEGEDWREIETFPNYMISSHGRLASKKYGEWVPKKVRLLHDMTQGKKVLVRKLMQKYFPEQIEEAAESSAKRRKLLPRPKKYNTGAVYRAVSRRDPAVVFEARRLADLATQLRLSATYVSSLIRGKHQSSEWEFEKVISNE